MTTARPHRTADSAARTLAHLAAAFLFIAATAGAGAAFAQQEETDRSGGLSPAEIEEIFLARTNSARMSFTPADVEFVTGMISHHAQALVMSAFASTNGASASIQILAARIINAQQDEIATMQRWLRDRDQPVPEVKIEGTTLVIEGGEHAAHGGHAAHMPGMLTPDQMEELAAAWGPEFDRLFLIYMIQHHSGAVTMVDDLIATDGAAQDRAVFKLASDIQVDQITEIERMRRMLAAQSGAGAGR